MHTYQAFTVALEPTTHYSLPTVLICYRVRLKRIICKVERQTRAHIHNILKRHIHTRMRTTLKNVLDM